jgi:nucleoid-associated protein YgaU
MGSFEKLGILVIVVIIVMILAVAIYQWGAGGEEIGPRFVSEEVEEEAPAPLIVDFVDVEEPEGSPVAAEPPASGTWTGGIPKRHTIRVRDTVWDLVVKEWRLKESFIPVIRAANPDLDFDRLRPGKVLEVPDPAAYRSASKQASAPPRTRRYEIQIGDNLESIARNHLGRSTRWRDIKALNPGLDERRLRPGQSILIPVK